MKADKKYREDYIDKLFRYVRLVKISLEYFLVELYSEDLLIEDVNCCRMLDEVRDYYMLLVR